MANWNEIDSKLSELERREAQLIAELDRIAESLDRTTAELAELAAGTVPLSILGDALDRIERTSAGSTFTLPAVDTRWPDGWHAADHLHDYDYTTEDLHDYDPEGSDDA